ncbi:hypothetical protein CEXT_23081, partial [Caerostris extrusa]
DIHLTASNDDQYFVFEDLLYQILLVFSRDTSVTSHFELSSANPSRLGEEQPLHRHLPSLTESSRSTDSLCMVSHEAAFRREKETVSCPREPILKLISMWTEPSDGSPVLHLRGSHHAVPHLPGAVRAVLLPAPQSLLTPSGHPLTGLVVRDSPGRSGTSAGLPLFRARHTPPEDRYQVDHQSVLRLPGNGSDSPAVGLCACVRLDGSHRRCGGGHPVSSQTHPSASGESGNSREHLGGHLRGEGDPRAARHAQQRSPPRHLGSLPVMPLLFMLLNKNIFYKFCVLFHCL